ncbi:hypothetical protein LJR038_004594 [Acidovorax sp. LjRoot38]
MTDADVEAQMFALLARRGAGGCHGARGPIRLGLPGDDQHAG